ncbi:MAG: hypothetical protein Q7R97_02385 [Candidatus Daviesbacteria bacterium]|nr:hypothetical protein [Candidatus Daviesbacteria bacterium]
MITPQTQIKLNLPLYLKENLKKRAAKFGITMAEYIRHLILKDVEDMDSPCAPKK